MRTLHLGELLVKQGALTMAQRDAVLLAQRDRGGPFGALAEEMFGVSPESVELAWAQQFASFAPHVDPRTYSVNPHALEIITRRQAWQFRILPIDFQGDEVVACTCEEWLVRAMKFAGWRLGHGVHFVLTEPAALGEALCYHFPMGGMTPKSVLADVA